MSLRKTVLLLIFIALCSFVFGKKADPDKKPDWAKKDIRDFSDADLERLLDQWEENEEPLPNDELPEHLRKPSQQTLDINSLNMKNPEEIMKLSKKGKTVMMFVHVLTEDSSRTKTEELTKIWQTGLLNSHIQSERYLVADDRAIFLFKDGAQAWDAKPYLLDQVGCYRIDLEGQTQYGNKVPPQLITASKDIPKDEL